MAGSRRVLVPLYGAGFVTAFGAHAVAANLAGYALGSKANLAELGILLALYDGAEILLKPFFGALADRVGAKGVLLGGLIGFAFASAAFVAAGGADTVGLARFGQGAAAAAFSPAAGAMVAVLGGRKGRGRAFGGYGGAKGLGYLLGPVGGGLLVAAGGYRLLFAILAALAAAVGIAAAVFVPAAAPAPRQRSTLVQLARRIWRPEFLQPVLVLSAGTAALSAGVGFLPVVGAQDGLGPAATGALVSVLALTSAVLQPWAGRLLDRGKIDAAKGGSLALVPIALGFLVAAMGGPVVALAVAALLIGAGVGWSTPLGFAGLAASAPEGRMGETMGAGEVGREAGDAGGPLIVGAFGGLGITAGLVALATAIWAVAATSRQLTRQRSVAPSGIPDRPNTPN